MKNFPRIGIGVAILNNQNQLLLGLRKSSFSGNVWGFPGGYLEFGEQLEKCAKREVLEEVNLVINNLKFLEVTNDIYPEQQKHYVTVIFTAKIKSGELKLMEPDKCIEWRWFDLTKLPFPLFQPIENLLKKHKIEELLDS